MWLISKKYRPSHIISINLKKKQLFLSLVAKGEMLMAFPCQEQNLVGLSKNELGNNQYFNTEGDWV